MVVHDTLVSNHLFTRLTRVPHMYHVPFLNLPTHVLIANEMCFRSSFNFMFTNTITSKRLKNNKMYMWYTTCPKCAMKYGKNYVAVISQVESIE